LEGGTKEKVGGGERREEGEVAVFGGEERSSKDTSDAPDAASG
jgi:hypothetical protein